MSQPHMMTNRILRASVLANLLVGVVGCNSQSQSEPPVVSLEAAETIVTSPPASPVGGVTESTSKASARPEAKGNTKALPDNTRVRKFAELDTNHDGLLNLTEFGAGRTSKDATKWFGRRDADHDGSLNLAEFVPQSAPAARHRQPEVKRSVTTPQPKIQE